MSINYPLTYYRKEDERREKPFRARSINPGLFELIDPDTNETFKRTSYFLREQFRPCKTNRASSANASGFSGGRVKRVPINSRAYQRYLRGDVA